MSNKEKRNIFEGESSKDEWSFSRISKIDPKIFLY